MTQFQFKLAVLQRYREHLRDVIRQELAELLARDAELARERDDALERRFETIHQMQQLQQQAALNVDQTAARRYHAGQLTAEAFDADMRRQQLVPPIAACRDRLIRADQSVKVLEQLADKQRREFESRLERTEERQREEAWQAGQLVKNLQIPTTNLQG